MWAPFASVAAVNVPPLHWVPGLASSTAQLNAVAPDEPKAKLGVASFVRPAGPLEIVGTGGAVRSMVNARDAAPLVFPRASEAVT